MRRTWGERAVVLGAALGVAAPSLAQSSLEVTVTAKQFDDARGSIQPSLGAQRYDFSRPVVEAVPQGEGAPLNQVLLRAPGVAQDSFGQIHVRGDHGNLQYRLDGVQLPEGLSLFSQSLATRFTDKMSLITGALPSQYGFRQAGVIDIKLKSGTSDPGAEAALTAGSRNHLQPAFSYGGQSGKADWFVTGQYLQNGNGIENPAPTWAAIHNDTQQWHGLAKMSAIVDDSTRLNFILGGTSAAFQIPQRSGQVPGFTVNGQSDFNSAALDQRQWEQTYFGMASLQKRYDTVDYQLSAFSRYSELAYAPDAVGDLMFNGIAPRARRTSLATGLQTDGSWKATSQHTLRSGLLVQRERTTSLTSSQVLPVDATASQTTDQPIGIVEGSDQIGWLFGLYLQDEWKATETVTVNFGARFDGFSATAENQLSPRVNVVWQPNDVLTAHAGYARYFTPPPLTQVNANAIAARVGTSGASPSLTNDPVRAERAHYLDMGFDLKPIEGLTLGFDAYYKIATNLLDEGQFGAPILLTSFNYANAEVKGVELSANYEQGPWSVFANLAWSEAKGSNINSAQFNFNAANLAFIQQNYIFLDHSQSLTASAGAAYVFNPQSPWATRLSGDVVYGNGLRRTLITPNDTAGPPYATVNLSLAQKLPVPGTRGATVRLDVLNLLDNSYQLRDGTGVGVGAPQFGLRRTFLVTLSQKF